jgi:hypothetical protein
MRQARCAVVLFVAMLAFSSVAQAQDNELLNIPRQQREGVTEFTVASPVSPDDVQFGDEWLVLGSDMTTAVMQNPATVFNLQIWKTLDDGITWTHVASFGFRGDPSIPAGTKPGIAVQASKVSIVGTRLKLRLDIPASSGRIGLGGSVVLTRTPQ